MSDASQKPRNFRFPFLFGGTFIEAMLDLEESGYEYAAFPFLFGGTFIEARWRPPV